LAGNRESELTLLGRINIDKTLVLSKFIYSASLLTINRHFVKEIDKISNNLIWEGKPAKVERSPVISKKKPKKHGGLKMLDFGIMRKALKVAWTDRLIKRYSLSRI